MIRSFSRVVGALATLVALSPAAAQDAGGYHVTKTIPVGGAGRWDYTLADAASHRLYVSHGTEVVVIDLDKDAVIGTVTPANGIHGIAVANELNRGFTSNGTDTTVTIFDLKSFQTIGTVKTTGANPDAIWYDDVSKRVFTFNGRGQNATAIDAAKGEVVGTIPLGGKPEFAQADAKGLLFVNIEDDSGKIVVIDAKAAKEVKRYNLPGCGSPSGLAIDRKNNRLFSACGGTKTMTVSDPATGKVITTVPICTGTDAAAFDPETALVFTSCGDGTMTVIHQDGADKYTSLGNVTTKRGARTMALDTRTHRVFLAHQEYGSMPAPDPNAPPPTGRGRGGPPAIPNTFAVLVLEKK